jgi:hypothetical protein
MAELNSYIRVKNPFAVIAMPMTAVAADPYSTQRDREKNAMKLNPIPNSSMDLESANIFIRLLASRANSSCFLTVSANSFFPFKVAGVVS